MRGRGEEAGEGTSKTSGHPRAKNTKRNGGSLLEATRFEGSGPTAVILNKRVKR